MTNEIHVSSELIKIPQASKRFKYDVISRSIEVYQFSAFSRVAVCVLLRNSDSRFSCNRKALSIAEKKRIFFCGNFVCDDFVII